MALTCPFVPERKAMPFNDRAMVSCRAKLVPILLAVGSLRSKESGMSSGCRDSSGVIGWQDSFMCLGHVQRTCRYHCAAPPVQVEKFGLYYALGRRPVGLVNLFLPRVLMLGRAQNRAHLLISKNFSCLVGEVEPRAGKKERRVGDSVNAHRKMAAVRGICHDDVTMAR